MSLVTMIQAAAMRIGFPSPPSVIGWPDQTIQQLLAFAQEEGEELSAVFDWQEQKIETSFTTVSGEVQVADIETVAPGWRFIINNTLWNRTRRWPILGPLPDETWQLQKAFFVSNPLYRYKITGNAIRFIPDAIADEQVYFYYQTRNFVRSSDGMTTRSTWLADTDLGILPEDIMCLGVIWRYKMARGLDFTADLDKYQRRVADAKGRNATSPVINMDNRAFQYPLGVILPTFDTIG